MHLQLILWTLRRRPWRNLLVMTSVAMTVAVMIGFFSTRIELARFFERLDEVPYQRFWVKSRNLATSQKYPLALQKQFEEIPGVQQVLYVVNVNSQTPDGEFLHTQGGPPAILEVERDFFPTDEETRQRWVSERTAAVIGEVAAKGFGLEVGDLAEIPTWKGPLKFKVVGISRGGPFPFRITVHYDYLDEFLGAEGIVNDFRIVLDKKTDSRPIVKAVDEILDTRGLASHMVSERTMMALRGADDAALIPNLLGALGLVLLVTTALAIANTTMIAVRERRAELATLRVLGFKKRSVALMIVNEIFVVCAVGGILGALLAWFAMRTGLKVGTELLPSVTMTKAGLIAGLATSLTVPLIGSVVSSWLAVRAPLSEALRDAG